jgi:hypothetical protein
MRVHYVYMVENLINEKIYIGKHTTDDLDDGYMGSGKILTRAIAKHGLENFRKTILSFFDTEEHAYEFEKSLVTKEFVMREDTYNLTCGGSGSWYAMNSNEEARKEKNKRAAQLGFLQCWNDEVFRQRASKRATDLWKKLWKEGKLKHCDWTGKNHSLETREKMSKTHQENQHQLGDKNSQFGTCWVHNIEQKSCKKIKLEELQFHLDNGWIKGRKMSW